MNNGNSSLCDTTNYIWIAPTNGIGSAKESTLSPISGTATNALKCKPSGAWTYTFSSLSGDSLTYSVTAGTGGTNGGDGITSISVKDSNDTMSMTYDGSANNGVLTWSSSKTKDKSYTFTAYLSNRVGEEASGNTLVVDWTVPVWSTASLGSS